jgi:HSP20 family protein
MVAIFDSNALRYYVMTVLSLVLKEGKKMKLVPYLRRSEAPITSRLFDEFFRDFPFSGSLLDSREAWIPFVDILEKNDTLILRAELPGMTEKDIDLKIKGNTLILKGERKMENETDKCNYHRMESHYGSFTRSFRLTDSVEFEKIKAEYKNGVLTITLPHKPEAKPREIHVSVH